MLRLMKYEYRKTLTSKLIFLGVLALGELFFLAGLMLNRNVAFPLEMNDNSLAPKIGRASCRERV